MITHTVYYIKYIRRSCTYAVKFLLHVSQHSTAMDSAILLQQFHPPIFLSVRLSRAGNVLLNFLKL